MRKVLATSVVLCLALILSAGLLQAQDMKDKSKRPSPPANASLDLGGGKSVSIDYSSPRVKGRKIYGELVPYGKVWRLGANEATTLVTTADLNIGGTTVPAGTYTVFAIPDKEKWTLVISKKTGEWGTEYPGPSEDLARIDMKVSQLPSPVENFTISFDKSGGATMGGKAEMGGNAKMGGGGGETLNVDWESTRASVAIAKK